MSRVTGKYEHPSHKCQATVTIDDKLYICDHDRGHPSDGAHIFAFHKAQLRQSDTNGPRFHVWKDGDPTVVYTDDYEEVVAEREKAVR